MMEREHKKKEEIIQEKRREKEKEKRKLGEELNPRSLLSPQFRFFLLSKIFSNCLEQVLLENTFPTNRTVLKSELK